ncbi:MAG: glucosamine-6-phosphate deaminase [Verrucomicrobia bacterium]|nr:glucosamine-6-phosphate deaminase [Verrucomicrobiota bacterium]MCH8514654.1 glucosamine-6-phosphate deaminase [Kiritimatiellia bacterium]
MEIILQPDAESASRLAARLIARLVREKPDAVLGLATGGTPLLVYRELIRLHREEGLDFSRVTTFNLDEYIGLAPEHPQSYHAYMREHLFRHLNIPPENTHLPEGLAADVPKECEAYEQAIRAAGGIDLQLLGIGADGHIGFNEPTSSLASRTRIKTLARRTVEDNARFFDGDASKVPRHCITMGIGTILEARRVVLLAFGKSKALAIAETVEGPVSANVPASVLQHHPVAKLFLDEEAGAELRRADYYRWIYANKPAWQQDA